MSLSNTRGTIRVLNSKINLNTGNLTDSDENQAAALNRNVENKNVFRSDLLMFAEGNLFTDETGFSAANDLSIVSGVYNYAQGITHRLMTARGTMPGDPFFGVPWYNYLGVTYSNPQNVIRSLVSDITDEIFKDSRTEDVLYVRPVFTEPTVVEVECGITPVRFDVDINLAVSVGV